MAEKINRMMGGEAAVSGAVKKLPLNLAISAPVCKIATFHPNSLASVLASLPAMVALRESFPGARICSFAPEGVVPLLDHFGAIDEAHGRPSGGLPAQAALMARLRTGDFDIAISFSHGSNALLLLWATAAGIRAGFVPSRLDAFLTHRVENEGALTVGAGLELVRSVGASPRGTQPKDLLEIPPGALKHIDSLLAASEIGGTFSVLAPISGRRSQNSGEREAQNRAWVSAMEELSQRGSVVVAGPKPLNLENAASRLPVPCLDLSGKLDILALLALCSRADTVLGDEPGVIALAEFLGKDCVKGTPGELAKMAKFVRGL